MVSERIKSFTGSLSALDELIERERESAAVAIEEAFQNDIRVATIRIGEINAISNARITAAAQIAVAKAATAAEVGVAALAALASNALGLIKRRASGIFNDPEDVNALISATSDIESEKIGAHSLEAIKTIESEAKAAIDLIKACGKDAIARIAALADEWRKQVDEDASHALEKLTILKAQPRVPREVVHHAVEAENLLFEQFKHFQSNLHDVVARAQKEMSVVADGCINEISVAVSEAERRIRDSRDEAIATLKRYAELQKR